MWQPEVNPEWLSPAAVFLVFLLLLLFFFFLRQALPLDWNLYIR